MTPALLRACRVAAWFTVGVGALVFVGGWIVGEEALTRIVPGTVVMQALTALGLIAAGVSLLLRVREHSPARGILADACAVFVLTLGTVVLAEYVFGWNAGIDELLFTDRAGRAQGIAHPGRFAPTTALGFILIGLALLTLDIELPRRGRPAELLMAPVAGMAVMTLVGYLYAIPVFYGPASATAMALNTGVCFFALALGIVLVRPRGRIVRLATTDDPGGIMLRRTAPLAIVIPLLLGWLALQGYTRGWVGERLTIWWLSAATIAALMLLIARVSTRLSRDAEARRVLEAALVVLANQDSLTGLYARRRFDEELVLAAARAARGQRYALLVMDFDRMKAVNDSLGHAAGDRLLEAVGRAFLGRVRASDIAGRLGGDEFAFLLADTTLDDAELMAEQLREAVASCRVMTPRGEAWTTISIGITELHGVHADPDAAMAEADRAMYCAKRNGGDRAQRATPSRPPAHRTVQKTVVST